MEKRLRDFGLWLSELRIKSGYESQRQLCLDSDVSPATLSRIEAGLQKPEPETLKKIAPFLKGVTYEDLLKSAGYLDKEPNEIIKEALAKHAELSEFYQDLEKREDLQMLFKQVRTLSPESIQRVIRYIKMVEDEESI